MNIALIATAWGAKLGGINAFNHDFAIGLAERLGRGGRVYCAVCTPTEDEIEEAENQNVTLIPVSKYAKPSDWVQGVQKWLNKQSKRPKIDWWIGHDVITGFCALKLTSAEDGQCCLIMHMSYIDYQSIKGKLGTIADEKHSQQYKLFNDIRVAKLAAVGPLLKQACRDIISDCHPQFDRVAMLVPGFRPNLSARSPNEKISAITFGRLDLESDRIKQGRLSVAAFARAIGEEKKYPGAVALQKAHMSFLGIQSGPEGKEQEDSIKKLALEHAGSLVSIFPLPYDDNRESLFRRLINSNLALMLSWHEGFGLAGWEAIATETPLIVGKDSGLYQLVKAELGGMGLGCLQVVSIEGNFDEEGVLNFSTNDLIAVCKAVREIACDLPQAKANARGLKKLLIQECVCTWANTAEQMLMLLNPSILRKDYGSMSVEGVSSIASLVSGVSESIFSAGGRTTSPTKENSLLDAFEALNFAVPLPDDEKKGSYFCLNHYSADDVRNKIWEVLKMKPNEGKDGRLYIQKVLFWIGDVIYSLKATKDPRLAKEVPNLELAHALLIRSMSTRDSQKLGEMKACLRRFNDFCEEEDTMYPLSWVPPITEDRSSRRHHSAKQ